MPDGKALRLFRLVFFSAKSRCESIGVSNMVDKTWEQISVHICFGNWRSAWEGKASLRVWGAGDMPVFSWCNVVFSHSSQTGRECKTIKGDICIDCTVGGGVRVSVVWHRHSAGGVCGCALTIEMHNISQSRQTSHLLSVTVWDVSAFFYSHLLQENWCNSLLIPKMLS